MKTTLEIAEVTQNRESRAGMSALSVPGKNRFVRQQRHARLSGKGIVAVTLATFLLVGADNAVGDAVTDWNAIMQETVETTPEPFLQIRSATMTQLAVFEAVNAIVRDYQPYLGKITAPPGASPHAAAIAAAHRTLVALHPGSAQELDALRATSLAAIPDGQAKNDGVTIGESAANAILALRADDGANKVVPYTPGTKPGDWQPTPPGFGPAFGTGIGEVDTFAIKNGRQFRLSPPPPLHSDKYARDFNEVKKIGDLNSTSRSQGRTDVARFYGVTEPIPIYNPAARQVSQAQGKSLSENARIFALVNIAIFDAAVAVFETKYFYNFWRPVTAIRGGDKDRNRKTDPDPNWMPLVETLPFPSYPSGHGGFGNAARYVLEQVFGEDGHSITLSNPLLPGIVLRYTSWKQITDDIDEARIDGGVHFRFEQEEAARLGRRVGAYIFGHRLRPIRDRSEKATNARQDARKS
jgi:hypothetical protein